MVRLVRRIGNVVSCLSVSFYDIGIDPALDLRRCSPDDADFVFRQIQRHFANSWRVVEIRDNVSQLSVFPS